jgi:hypothetical protein
MKDSKITSASASATGVDKRRAPRYRLFADAEIFESHSGTRLQARTSDMSLFGCYVNSVNWLPPGSEIQLQIAHKNGAITVGGRVVRCGTAQGIGVEFTVIPAAQKAILKDWLADARLG